MMSLDYKTIFDTTDVGIATVEADSTISLANAKLLDMLQVTEKEFLGSSFLEWVHSDDRAMLEEYHTKRVQGIPNVPQNYKIRLNTKSGFLWASINITFFSESGVTIASVFDITQTEQKMLETINAQNAILAAIPDLMFELDKNGNYLNVWAQKPQELAASKQQLLGNTIEQILPDSAAKKVMSVIKETYKKGISCGHQIQINIEDNELWFELSCSLKQNSNAEATVIMLSRNITDRKELESKLLHLSRYDSLTSLYNRRTLQEILQRDMHSAIRYDTPLSLCMLDIDFFKNVNDSYGHLTGDDVLRQFSQLIQSTLRESDYSGRYGGEEFVVVLPNTTLSHAFEFAQRLRNEVASLRFQKNTESTFSITVSIGVASIDKHTTSTDKLLKNADIALYFAKDAGRNCVKKSH